MHCQCIWLQWIQTWRDQRFLLMKSYQNFAKYNVFTWARPTLVYYQYVPLLSPEIHKRVNWTSNAPKIAFSQAHTFSTTTVQPDLVFSIMCCMSCALIPVLFLTSVGNYTDPSTHLCRPQSLNYKLSKSMVVRRVQSQKVAGNGWLNENSL